MTDTTKNASRELTMKDFFREETVAALAIDRMVAAYDLHPPLEVEAKVGERWGRVRPLAVNEVN